MKKITETILENRLDKLFDIIIYLIWPASIAMLTINFYEKNYGDVSTHIIMVGLMILYFKVFPTKWEKFFKYLIIILFTVPFITLLLYSKL